MSNKTFAMIKTICFSLALLGVLYYFKRYDWMKRIDYFFSRLRFRTNYILLCEYLRGFDMKYDEFKLSYLVADNKGIWICPIYSVARKTLIPYSSITCFTVVYESDANINDLIPKNIYTIDHIYIKHTIDADSQDELKVIAIHNSDYVRYNKYVFSKANLIQYVLAHISENKYVQRLYDRHQD